MIARVCNEKSHAFLAARFYARLTEAFGERGAAAFIHATRYYGEQRGRRMAQRAIRDGALLTYTTYCRYGEWVNTPELRQAGLANESQVLSWQPDFVRAYSRCPWHDQFQEMGAQEAGAVYCRHVDRALCRGFNPELEFLVEQTLHEGHTCVHRVRNARVLTDADLHSCGNGLRDFQYHCAHLYWTFHQVCGAIFEEAGRAVAEAVLADFQETYGAETAQTIQHAAKTNFSVCT